MIRKLCERKDISLVEFYRCIDQTSQNFDKKLKRGTVSFREMIKISEVLEVNYEQSFIFPDGKKIGFGNR